MKLYSKSDINNVLKEHGYGSIESDKVGNGGMNAPFRDWEGKILKGISLFTTSPMTMTNAGSERGTRIVNELVKDLGEMGKIKRLSDFGFIAAIPTSNTKCIVLKGNLSTREGLVYASTYHYLNVSQSVIDTKDIKFDEVATYTDKPTEKHELTNEYLDYILGRS